MRFNLKAATDVAAFAVYDPASVPHLIDGSTDLAKAKEQAIAAGAIFGLEVIGDGEERASVLIEEELPESWRNHVDRSLKGCLLKVPSGRLVFSGQEDLWPCRGKVTAPERFEPTMGEGVSISPGNYLVDAYTVEWGEELESQLEQIKKPADKVADNAIGPVAGFMIFCTILILPAVLTIVATEWDWKHAWPILKWALIAHAVFWPLWWVFWKFSGADSPEYLEKTDALLTAHPTFVLRMVRLADAAKLDDLRGGMIDAD